jgi:hypothetical protein
MTGAWRPARTSLSSLCHPLPSKGWANTTAAELCTLYAKHASVTGGGRMRSFASLRRFCAIAAIVNSNWAPHGPRKRRRPSRKMRLRCANSTPTSSCVHDGATVRFNNWPTHVRSCASSSSSSRRKLSGFSSAGMPLRSTYMSASTVLCAAPLRRTTKTESHH